jgi:lysophospholipase L1-like esterase
MDRRQLIQSIAVTVAASSVVVSSRRSLATESSRPEEQIDEGAVVLFQGDSITDARRDKQKFAERPNDARALGDGYPFLIASELLRDYPEKKLKIFNRGISGNKVPNLHKRWQKDCLDMKPGLLSIMIGVNDIWHKMNGKYDGTVEDYRKGFTELLEMTKKELPGIRLVICEPFALRCGAVKDAWFPEFDERRRVAAEIASAAGAVWVPFQKMFDTAIASGVNAEVWAADGVHPTVDGHALMAETWRKCTGL